MASYLSLKKMKRKELEEVSDDFSDFSLSSPARKIRRLVIFFSFLSSFSPIFVCLFPFLFFSVEFCLLVVYFSRKSVFVCFSQEINCNIFTFLA